MSKFSRGLCESSTCTTYHLQCLNEESGLMELISSFLGFVVYYIIGIFGVFDG